MARTEELFEEVIANARKDRAKLEKLRDNLTNLKPEQSDVIEAEPLAMLGVAENVARIHDVLVKVNGQLVELAKISAKLENPDADKSSDREDLFDVIEKQSTVS